MDILDLFFFFFFYQFVSVLPCIEKTFPQLYTFSNHDKCFRMLIQWFCITHNSMPPVLPPIWDRPAPTAETELVLPVCSSSIGPSVPACRLLCRSSAVSQSMTMQTKGETCSSSRHFYPPPTLTSLQVWGSFCSTLSFSLYPSACCLVPQQPTPITTKPPLHTHTLYSSRQGSSETICVVFAVVILSQLQMVWVNHEYHQRHPLLKLQMFFFSSLISYQ